MAHHFRLLFEAVAVEPAAVDHAIAISAEGVPHQREIEAAAGLRLPDMGHFVDEEALQGQAFLREIFRPEGAVGVEMDVSGRRHDDAPGLKRPPFAADDPYPVIVDGIAEHGAGEVDLALSQGSRAFHPVKASAATLACPVSRVPLGQPKI